MQPTIDEQINHHIAGRHDFEYFVKHILRQEYLPIFTEWFLLSNTGKVILGTKRASGRTTFNLYYALHRLIYGNKYESIVYLTHSKLCANDIVYQLYELVRQLDGPYRDVFELYKNTLRTKNGNKIEVMSPSHDTLMRRTFDVWILDNAELYTDKNWEDVYNWHLGYPKSVVITTI